MQSIASTAYGVTSQQYTNIFRRANSAHKWKSMTVEEIQQHPEYPYTNWPLEAKKKGKLDVAHGRGGPLKIAWEVHGDGPTKLVVCFL